MRPGRYVVTGVASDDAPMVQPPDRIDIEHDAASPPWRLVVGDAIMSRHRTLRNARYAASALYDAEAHGAKP